MLVAETVTGRDQKENEHMCIHACCVPQRTSEIARQRKRETAICKHAPIPISWATRRDMIPLYPRLGNVAKEPSQGGHWTRAKCQVSSDT